MSNQTADDLRRAADLIEKDGWTQGDYVDDRNCRCAVGALVAVMGGDGGPSSVPAAVALVGRLDAALDALATQVATVDVRRWNRESLITEWNDEGERDSDDVTTAMRAAADKADQS